MNDLSGTNIKGYEIKEELDPGTGGMGKVYRAVQSSIGRDVVMKVIKPEYANLPDYIRRFELEAQLVAKLDRIPHIVTLIDYWRDPDGAYLIMQWMPGGSLRGKLASNGGLDIESVVMIIEQIAGALHAAHRNQVIHRDIKPGNILLDEDGNAFLSDFGIAKDTLNKVDITRNEGIGTPGYAAPEQLKSEPVTPQSDIYSLGIVLYELLERQHPFPASNMVDMIFKQLNEPLPELQTPDDDVRDALNTVVQKATAKDPVQRFRDVMEMAQALREAAKLSPSQAGGFSLAELLTPREQEVIQLMIDGKSNREIASILVLAESSIKSYVKRIYRKLKVRSRIQAIARARDLNFVIQKPAEEIALGTGLLPEPENPYKGLDAFEAGDEHIFFGRDNLIIKLIQRMQEDVEHKRFIAIVGPSGSGKSSVTRAGFIPALWRGELPGSEKWYIADMLPGPHPIDALEVALVKVASENPQLISEQLQRDERGLLRVADMILPDDSSELLIVIDQFEEVFTLVEDEKQRLHFLDLIRTAAVQKRSRVRIVVTLRADYYDRPLQYPEFGVLMRNRLETVLPLTADELEQAIRHPTENVGVDFEDGLVSKIISDVHYQPGALPLLQYALTELFERRDGRTLTLQAYTDIGGTGGALAKCADEIFMEGNDGGQALVKQLFLRLVTLGEGAEDTRRRVDRSELLEITDDPELMDEIIDIYAQSRLLSLDHDPATRKPTVEVAHEAILREWDRLRDWLNNSRDDIKQERQIAQEAEAWQVNNRDKSYLRAGSKLEQAEHWQQYTELALTPLVYEFIQASLQDAKAQELAEAERVRREKEQEERAKELTQRALRLFQGLVAVFIVATIMAGGLALFAFDREGKARDAQATSAANVILAERKAAVNHSLVLANDAWQAFKGGEPALALALALEAASIEDAPAESMRVLRQITLGPGTRAVIEVPDASTECVTASPDGHYALICSGVELILWDMETMEEIRRFEASDSGTNLSVAFSPDGKTALSGHTDGDLLLWDVGTTSSTFGELIQTINFGPESVLSVAFSPDGRRVVSGHSGGKVALWDIENSELIQQWVNQSYTTNVHVIAFSPDDVHAVAISPDGKTIAAGASEGTIRCWDVDETSTTFGVEIFRDVVGGIGPGGIAFSPDNHHILVGANNWLFTLNLETGEVVRFQSFYGRNPLSFSTSVDGEKVFFSGRRFVLWDVAQWQEVYSFSLSTSPKFLPAAMSADGRFALAALSDGILKFWNIGNPVRGRRFEASDVQLLTLEVSPDGHYMIAGTGAPATQAILWDTETGEQIHRLSVAPTYGSHGVAFSPDGRQILIGSRSGDIFTSPQGSSLTLWDTESGVQIRQFEGHNYGVMQVAFSPDGNTLLSASNRAITDAPYGELFLWDTETGEKLRTFGTLNGVVDMALSSDGLQVLTASEQEPGARLWHVETEELIHQFEGHTADVRSVAFSADNQIAITGSNDSTLILWDVETGDELSRLIGHNDQVSAVTVSPDGAYILSGDQLGVIILWDFATGEELLRLEGHGAGIKDIAFGPDGQVAYSLAFPPDNSIIEWKLGELPITLDEVLTWIGDNRYVRELTCAEREHYRIEPYCEDG